MPLHRWIARGPWRTLWRARGTNDPWVYHDSFLVPPFLFPQKNPLQPQRRWHQVRILVQHSLTDSMRHAPGRLIRHAEHPMKLLSANALPAGTQQIRGHQPFGQRNPWALKRRSDRHCELLAAVHTLPQIRPMRLTLELIRLLSARAMRANRPLTFDVTMPG